MEILIYILLVLLGAVLGVTLNCLLLGPKLIRQKRNSNAVGTFILNESDPERELFTIRFEDDVLKYKNGDKIYFTVVREQLLK